MTTLVHLSLRAAVVAVALAVSATGGLAQNAAGIAHSETDPGWTGRSVVIGSHSTLAGTADATREHQTGQY